MFYKTYESRYGIVIAVCDEDLSGKKLKMKDGGEFFVNPRFYGTEKVDKKGLVNLFRNCVSGNLVGKKCVDIAKEVGLITDENITDIDGVPHAQFFVMSI
jgi:hypothetical protein